MGLIILIKRKGSKNPMGFIRAKKGVSREKLRSSVGKRLKRGLTFKIVTSSELKRMVLRMGPRILKNLRRRRKKSTNRGRRR